jgi:hypothetical protein
MANIDLTPILIEKYGKKTHKPGRYNASELYSLIHGHWLKPEDYLHTGYNDVPSILRMWMGIGGHEQIQSLFPAEECEIKKEWQVGDMTLVGKCDRLLPGEVWEIKTSAKEMDKAKPWAEHQAKLYCTMFERPQARVLQPIVTEGKVVLKELAVVYRDDKWFEGELKKLAIFHRKVLQCS